MARVEELDRRLLMSAGSPDTTFGSGGTRLYAGAQAAGSVVDLVSDGAAGERLVLTALPALSDFYGFDFGGMSVKRYLGDGTRDLTFGSFEGSALLSLGVSFEPVKLLRDPVAGGLFVAGSVFRPLQGGAGFSEGDLALVKLTPTGQLDTSFGSGLGYRLYDLSSSGTKTNEFTRSAMIDASGRVVFSATSDTSASNQRVYMRVLGDGTPDTSFGEVSLTVSPGAFALPSGRNFNSGRDGKSVMTATPDGGYLVVGADGLSGAPVAMKLTAGGLLDNAFDGDGFKTLAYSGGLNEAQVVFTGTGTTAYVGMWQGEITAISTVTGATDTGFASAGLYRTALIPGIGTLGGFDGAYDTTRNRLVFALMQSATPTVIRYLALTTGGLPDLTYAGTGLAGMNLGLTAPSTLGGAVNSPKVMVGNPYAFVINSGTSGGSDGILGEISSIENGGVTTLLEGLSGRGVSEARAVAVSPIGKTLTVYTTKLDRNRGGRLVELRVNVTDRNGSPLNGFFTTDFENPSVGGAFALPDGKWLIAFSGRNVPDGTTSNTAVHFARLNPDGTLDAGFGSGGFVEQLPGGVDSGWTMRAATLSAGGDRVLVAGQQQSSNRGFVAGYSLDGNTDITFGTNGLAPLGTGGGVTEYSALAVDKVLGTIYAVGTLDASGTVGLVDSFAPAGAFLEGRTIASTLNGQTFLKAVAFNQEEKRVYVGGYAFNPNSPFGSGALLAALDVRNPGLPVAGSFGIGGRVELQLNSFESEIRGLVVDPAIPRGVIAAGVQGTRASLVRYGPDGELDGNYGLGVDNAEPLQTSALNAVTVDPLNRIVAVGVEGSAADGQPRGAVVRRFVATLQAGRPFVASIQTPTPLLSQGTGTVVLLLRTQGGARIDESTLPNAVNVIGPDGIARPANLNSGTVTTNGSQTSVTYTYTAASGTTFGESPRGTYTVLLVGGVLRDTMGQPVSGTDSAVATVTPARPLLSGAGDPDRSFGGTGAAGFGVAVQSGRGVDMVVRGTGLGGSRFTLSQLPSSVSAGVFGFNGGIAVYRSTDDGSYDSSWGVSGAFTFDLGAGVEGVKLIDLGAGNGFYVVGSVLKPVTGTAGANRDVLLVKLTEAGRLDTNFGGGQGYLTYDLDGAFGTDVVQSAGIDSLGRILISGQYSPIGPSVARPFFFRLTSGLNRDVSFANNGSLGSPTAIGVGAFWESLPGDAATDALWVMPDGSFYTGYTEGPGTTGVYRHLNTGAIDPAFGLVTESTTRSGNATVQAVRADLTGVYVLATTGAGSGGIANGELAVTRFNPDGSLDSSWGTAGFWTYGDTYGPAVGLAFTDGSMALHSDGRLVVSAVTRDPQGELLGTLPGTQFVQVGISPTGSRDATFAGTGDPSVYSAGGALTGAFAPVVGLTTSGSAYVLASDLKAGGLGVASPLDLGDTRPWNHSVLSYPILFPASGFAVASAEAFFTPSAGAAEGVAVATDPATKQTLVVAVSNVGGVGGRLVVRSYDRFGALVGEGASDTGRFQNIGKDAAIVRLASGKFMVAFSAVDTQSGSPLRRVILARFAHTAVLDTSFGTGGYVGYSPVSLNVDFAGLVTTETDASPLSSGTRVLLASTIDGNVGLVTQFDQNGFVDASYTAGGGGSRSLVSGDVLKLSGITVERSGPNAGRAYVVAERSVSGQVGGALFALTAGGDPDPGFGTSGLALFDVPGFGAGSGMTYATAVTGGGAGGVVYVGGAAVGNDDRGFWFLGALDAATGAATTFGPMSNGFVIESGPGTRGSFPRRGSAVNAIGIDGSTGTPALVVVGAASSQPMLKRFSTAGVEDTSYAMGFSPAEDGIGGLEALTFDGAGRPVVAGYRVVAGGLLGGGQSPVSAVVGRFRQVSVTAPSLTGISITPAPVFGETSAKFVVTFQAQTGLNIDLASLSRAIKIVRPTGSAVFATVVETSSPDDGRTVRVVYSYVPEDSTFGPFLTNGTYGFVLAAGGLRDEVGTIATTTDDVITTRTYSFPTPAPVNGPDPRFGGTGSNFGAGDLTAGRIVDVLRASDGSTFVLTNLPSLDNVAGYSPSGALAVRRFTQVGGAMVLDATFGGSGSFVFSLGTGVAGAKLLEAATGGGLYVVGTSHTTVVPPPNQTPVVRGDVLVIRLTATGQLDTASGFGGSVGYKTYDLGNDTHDIARSAVLDGTGGLVVSAQTTLASTAFAAFLKVDATTGVVATGFGDASFALSSGAFYLGDPGRVLPDEPDTLAAAPGGGFYAVLIGAATDSTLVARFDSAGMASSSFGFTGIRDFDIGPEAEIPTSLAVGTDGSLYIAVISDGTSDLYVLKVSGVDGLADQTWGGNGNGIFNLFTASGATGPWVSASAVAGAGGTLKVVATSTGNQEIFMTLSLLSDGTLDASYAGSGVAQAALSGLTLSDSQAVDDGAGGLLVALSIVATATNLPADPQLVLVDPAGFLGQRFDVVPTPGLSYGVTQAVHVNATTGAVFSVFTSVDPLRRSTLGVSLVDRNGVTLQSTLTGAGVADNWTVAGVVRRASDGKFVVVASGTPSGVSGANVGVYFVRFNADGTLDTTYGSGGFQTASGLGSGIDVVAFAAVANVAGDRVYVSGSLDDSRFLALFDVEGVLDGAAGLGDGFVLPSSGLDLSAFYALVVNPTTGQVYAGGYRDTQSSRGTLVDEAIIQRFDGATLALDTGFGQNGLARIAIASAGEEVRALALDTIANVIYAGGRSVDSVGRRWFVGAFNLTTNAMSTTFSAATNGVVRGANAGFLTGVNGLAIDPAGGAVIAAGANGNNRPLLRRIGADGTLDPSFGLAFAQGSANLGEYRGLTVDAAGRVITFGSTGTPVNGPRLATTTRFTSTVTAAPEVTNVIVDPVSFGDTTATITVTYQADVGLLIDPSTVAGAIRYTRPGTPGGTFFTASVVGTPTTIDGGRTLTVVYTITSGTGSFNASSNGTYEIFLTPGALTDDGGNPAPVVNTALASVVTDFVPVAPTGSLPSVPPLSTANSFDFSVTFTAAAGRTINPVTIRASNVTVTGPGGQLLAVSVVSTVGSGQNVTVTYRTSLASGTFFDLQGGFTVATTSVTANAVLDNQGTPTTAISLGSLMFIYESPTPSLSLPPLPSSIANQFDFTVTYVAGTGRTIDLTSIGAGNITVSGPGGQLLTVSVTGTTGSNQSVTVTYVATLAAGTFLGNQGTYTIDLGPTSLNVRDDLAVPTSSMAALGSLAVQYSAPSVSLPQAPALPLFGASVFQFALTYAPSVGRILDPSTFVGGNVSVTGPGGVVLTASVIGVASAGGDDVTVTYAATLPGRQTFGAIGSGTYVIALGTTPARDDLAVAVAAGSGGTLASVAVAYDTPSASLAVPAVPAQSTASLTFSVVYTAVSGRTISVASLASGNIAVTLPGGATVVPTLVSTSGSGQTMTAVYSLSAPSGTFGQSLGTYAFEIGASPATDDLGTPVAAGALGSLVVQYTSPSAALGTVVAPAFGDTTLTFPVTFIAGVGRTLVTTQFDGDEIVVVLPGGTSVAATVVSVAGPGGGGAASGGTGLTYVVTYRITLPASGFAAAGQYSVSVVAGTISDELGTPIAAGALGTFTVAFPRPTASATAPAAPAFGATSVQFAVNFAADSASTIVSTGITGSSLSVRLPDGSSRPVTLVSFGAVQGNVVSVLFSFTSASGVFDAAANGTYVVSTVEGGVTDTRGVPVAAATLFEVVVAVDAVSPGVISSVSVAAGPFLPGQNVFPVARVASGSTLVGTTAFTVRFSLVVGTQRLAMGDVAVAAIGPGASLDVTPPAGVPLPPSSLLPAGAYRVVAVVLDAQGVEISGSEVTAVADLQVTEPPRPTVGSLDPTFGGGDGIVTTFVAGPQVTLVGSVGIAGTGGVIFSGGFTSDGDFVLLRFNADGSFDRSIGDNGLLRFEAAAGSLDIASVFLADGQGRLLLGGTAVIEGERRFAVLRFIAPAPGTSDLPQLDTTFGAGGIRTYTPAGGEPSTLRSITIDKFGRPYLLGSVQVAGAGQGLVIRLTPSGTVDATFGALGVVSAASLQGLPAVIPLTDGASELTSLRLLNSRIVIGGFSGDADGTRSRFVVLALNYNGSLDRTFATRGVFATTLGSSIDRVTSVQEAGDGSVYVGGSRGTSEGTSTTAVIFRLTAAGRLDRAFNRGEILPLDAATTFGTVSSMLLSANNTLLVTVATANSLDDAGTGRVGTVAFRLTAAGRNDPFFNNGSPLIVFDTGLTLTATGGGSGSVRQSFEDFVQSKQGATTVVEGGAVRSLASRSTGVGTALSVAQLTRDGADLVPTLAASIPATVRPGYRGRATVSLANIGSLPANGRFSVTLVADSAGGTDVSLPSRTLTGRIPAGARRGFNVQFVLPNNLTPGTYTLSMSLGDITGFVDISVSNNVAARPGTFNVAAASNARTAGTARLAQSAAGDDSGRNGVRSLFSGAPVDAGSDDLLRGPATGLVVR